MSGTVTHEGRTSSNHLGSNITNDAWGRLKVANDFSLWHGVFTFDIPSGYWKEVINGVEQTSFTNATSVDGELDLKAGATLNDKTALQTFRHPRYQPNRGHLYSSSMFVDNPTANMVRDFGVFTEESGVFFRFKSDGIYAVKRTTISSVTTDDERLIDPSVLPPGFDASKGNIYDIQMQWRGVGNFQFYIGNPDTGACYLVYQFKNLGTLDNLSVFNPAMPIAFACENLGDNDSLRCGCVDLTAEGGRVEKGFYGSLGITTDSGQVAVSGFNVPVLAVRSVVTNGGGLINTRDIIALTAIAYGDQRCVMRIWATRDFTAITENDQSWLPFRDGNIEYIEYDNPNVATPMTFDTAKAELIFTARVDQDQSYDSTALFDSKTDIYQTPGDMFVFTMHRETGGAANVGFTYEFAEEV